MDIRPTLFETVIDSMEILRKRRDELLKTLNGNVNIIDLTEEEYRTVCEVLQIEKILYAWSPEAYESEQWKFEEIEPYMLRWENEHFDED